MRVWKEKVLATFLAVGAVAGAGFGVVFYTTSAQRSDALVINLAGAQRMLSQKLVKEALQLRDPNPSFKPETAGQMLVADIKRFDRVLRGLDVGDRELGLPPSGDAVVRAQLGRVREVWRPLHGALSKASRREASEDDWKLILQTNVAVLQETDTAVKMLQDRALAGAEAMISIQVAVLMALLGSMAFSWTSIVSPLLERISDSVTKTEEEFRALLEVSPEAVLIVDASGKVVQGNPEAERIFGHSSGELPGVALDSLVRPFTGARAQTSAVRRDGSEFPAEVSARAIAPPGSERWTVLSVRDVTEQKETEAQLVRERQKADAANQAKSEFLAAMSHEIRTPMNAILGMADLLWESDLRADQRQYVEMFRRAGGNLLLLIDSILDLSKIEAGRFELEHVDFDLEDVVDEAVELVGARAHAKGLSMMLHFSPEVEGARRGDPVRLRQVLLNLLSNAVKFTETGSVTLSVEQCRNADEVRLTVTDTGIGIAPDKIKAIFENFTQADLSITRKYGGSGLGLSISRHLVSLMGGDLTAESKPGKGSAFSFSIKLPAATGPVKASTSRADLHGCRVLIIDNNAANRLLLRETLASLGLECADAGSAEEGIRHYASAAFSGQPFSYVFVDRHMPRLDGFEVAEKIRRLGGKPIMLLLSSDMMPGDVTRSVAAGFAGYAVKPVRRPELLRLLGQHVPSRAVPAEAVPTTVEPEESSTPLRILIADDSPDNRILYEAYLKDTQHAVTFVEDGQEAVEQFGTPDFDVVLMDVAMPNLDGLSATRMIRAIEKERELPRTPIVACTAYARPEDLADSKESGCDAHISKPVSRQKLLSVIESLGTPRASKRRSRELAAAIAGRDRIRIQIPVGLEHAVPRYLARRREEAKEFDRLLRLQEYDKFAFLAHSLKGTGTGYGMPKLTELGGAMESFAKSGDEVALRRQLDELNDYLNRVDLNEAPAAVE